MKVLALTPGDPNLASTQFRLGQFVAPLAAEGISLTLMPAKNFRSWKILRSYDLVILQKRLMSVPWLRKLRAHSKRLIFDTDDAIWEPHARKHSLWTRFRTDSRLKTIARSADLCTVPNEHLADHLRGLGAKVAWIPMALDPEIWHPPATRAPGQLRIGWAGAPPNLLYLSGLSSSLHEIQIARPETEIHIYCGQPPIWNHPVRSVFHEYSPGTEAAVVRTFDIGLLPLPDDAFAAGKSPIKALQYAACGIPCIASPVGATKEIVLNDETGITARTATEWSDALLTLIDDSEKRRRLGQEASRRFLENHTLSAVQRRLADCWTDVIRSS